MAIHNCLPYIISLVCFYGKTWKGLSFFDLVSAYFLKHPLVVKIFYYQESIKCLQFQTRLLPFLSFRMFVYALKEACSTISPGLWTTPCFMHVSSELKLNNQPSRENPTSLSSTHWVPRWWYESWVAHVYWLTNCQIYIVLSVQVKLIEELISTNIAEVNHILESRLPKNSLCPFTNLKSYINVWHLNIFQYSSCWMAAFY